MYEGWVKNGKKHGIGRTVYVGKDGSGARVHFGMYANDMQNGLGLNLAPDGSKYIGEWWGSIRNGHGLYYDSNTNTIFNGEWNMGQ